MLRHPKQGGTTPRCGHWGPLLLLYGHGAGLQGACGRRARQGPPAGIPGLVRLGGSPGWVAQLGKGVLRQRGQGAGDEGRAGCGELSLADQPGCTLRAAVLLGRRNRRLGVTLSGWDATGGTLKEQLPPAGLEVQKPRAPLRFCEAVGARGAVEQQAGQEQPQCPGPHLSGGIPGPRDINCPKSQRERCTERSSEEFGRALEKETALLKDCKSTWSKRARAERIGGLSKSGMRGKPAGGAVSESASKRAPPSGRPAE